MLAGLLAGGILRADPQAMQEWQEIQEQFQPPDDFRMKARQFMGLPLGCWRLLLLLAPAAAVGACCCCWRLLLPHCRCCVRGSAARCHMSCQGTCGSLPARCRFG